MKWYIDQLEMMKDKPPVYSVCGDDCAVCPRYMAKTDEQLHETAVFWHNAGWRDHVVSNDEIRCNGCGTRGTCAFMILPCVKTHGVHACRECTEYPCQKTEDLLNRSEAKKQQCAAACENEREFAMLCRAFYEKEHNLREWPCRIPYEEGDCP